MKTIEQQLDDMLPEQFGVLTRHWLGDLDGMTDRRVIRVLVISGTPQFFYYQNKPRGPSRWLSRRDQWLAPGSS